jgi:hypothetical protein
VSLDSALRGVAKSVLGQLGTSVSVRVVTAGNYDTTTGTASDTTADTSCKANLRDIAGSELFGLAEITDQVCMVAASALSAAPKPRDKVVISSAVYDIIEVRTHRAKDLAVAYDLIIRGPLA